MYSYNSVIDVWSPKESDTGEGGGMADAVIDDVDLFGQSVGGSAIPDNHYFYVLTLPSSPGNSRDIENASIALPTSKLGQVYTALKSALTFKYEYISFFTFVNISSASAILFTKIFPIKSYSCIKGET